MEGINPNFDSWAGLLMKKILNFVFIPTLNILEYVKTLNVPRKFFQKMPNGTNFLCEIVKPDAICIGL